VGALCFSAVGFIGVNVRPGALSMEEGRSLAAKTAETVWPGSEFVAGVAIYSSTARVIDRPERLTYYYRNDRDELLRISFMNADRLAVEVRKYESEDEIDFTALKGIPAGAISYDTPLQKAEQNGGVSYRQRQPSFVVRVILTWPRDRDGPVYTVIYAGTVSGRQIDPFRVCCFDAMTGELVDSLVAPRLSPPWPVPADCAAARSTFRQVDRFQAYFVVGPRLSVGTFANLNYQGDNFVWVVGGKGIPRLERATNADDATATAELVNPAPPSIVAGQGLSSATLRLPVPGCWTVEISAGTEILDYVLYAYPWDCRPQHEAFAVVPGVTPLPCAKR
jgi:hypothetical protein